MSKKKLSIVALLATLALALPLSGAAQAVDTALNIPLNNNTTTEIGVPGIDCPIDTSVDYWHFVISPNNGHSDFITFYLNLGDATPYVTSIFDPNGIQLDNVFVAVPDGKTLTSLIKTGSSADIIWDGTNNQPEKFQLSHICPAAAATPPTVTKDAAGSYDDTFEWDITKEVKPDAVLTAGGAESTPVDYTVTVSHGDSVVSNVKVTGTITVSNPNTAAITLDSITDTLPGATCTLTNGDDSTPLVLTVGPGDTIFKYSCNLGSTVPSEPVTNNVAIAWSNQSVGGKQLAAGTTQWTTGAVDFTANEIDECATVVDDNATPGDETDDVTLGTVCVGGEGEVDNAFTFKYQRSFADPAGTCTDHENIASFTTNDTYATGSDDAKVTDCQGADLTVTKTATPSFDKTYTWDITKDVDKTSITTDAGSPATFNYTVKVSHDDGTDSNWQVTGTITVHNPNDWEAVTLTNVSDSVNNGGDCVVSGNKTQTILAGGDSTGLTYTCTYLSAPNPAIGTNTATATWDAAAASTPNGTADGTAGFDFGKASPNLIDECVDVVDDHATPGDLSDDVALGTACVGDPNPKTFTYSLTFNGPAAGTCEDHTNTASFTTNDTDTDGSDSVTVRVCSFGPRLTPGYWKTHLAQNGTSGCTGLPNGTGCSSNGPWAMQDKTKMLGTYGPIDTQLKAANVFVLMNCSNSGSASSQNQNSIGCLAGHLLAAKYNRNINSSNPCIDPVINTAQAFLTSGNLITFGTFTNVPSVNYIGPTGNYSLITTTQRNLAIALKTALDQYNNGGYCH